MTSPDPLREALDEMPYELWNTESGHRVAPRKCAELMSQDATCDCGQRRYERIHASLRAAGSRPFGEPMTSPDPRYACTSDFTLEGGSFGPCSSCGSDEPHVRALATPPLDAERLYRAMNDAFAALDDQWTMAEFAELSAAEYALAAADRIRTMPDDYPDY